MTTSDYAAKDITVLEGLEANRPNDPPCEMGAVSVLASGTVMAAPTVCYRLLRTVSYAPLTRIRAHRDH